MRDSKGRFKKSDDGITMNLNLPSLTKIIFLALALILIFPWIVITSKLELFGRIFSFFESIMTRANNDPESSKKNGLFY